MKDFVVGLAVSTIAVFAPIKSVILVTGLLIFADLITGILAARKKKQPITSAGLRRTVTKIFVYNAAILLGFLAETYMLEGFIPISKIASGLIAVVEMASLLENLNIINGSPVFKALIQKLGSINDSDKEE
jgi:phage-related holin